MSTTAAPVPHPSLPDGEVEPLDPFDDAQIAEFHAVYEAADRYGRRFACPFSLHELAITQRTTSVGEERLAFLVRVDGAIAGVAGVEVPLLDNTDQLFVDIQVAPQHRRRGLGTLLAQHAAVLARERGRAVWNGWVAGREVDGPETPTPGEAFAASLGLRLGRVDVQRRLPLPVPSARLEELRCTAARQHEGYSFDTWVDHCPDEHLAAYCRLKSLMNSEAPVGELEVEDEVWDETRLRESERELGASGRIRYVCVALAPDGSMVGHNELVVPAEDPGIYQWDTLVLPAHRGHRLGLALKVANVAVVQDRHPDRTSVRTFNAVSNTAMIAVNEVLGFVPVEYQGEWQGPVPV
ncbi:MAG: GNAT family N-acetyltransferase [Nocardioidaceae bacterium]|nr:GNAT family N-acetyltransferase [Nocardioidaceae bacterium]